MGLPYYYPAAISGAKYSKVPTLSLNVCIPPHNYTDKPKSVNFNVLISFYLANIIFSGLISLCIIFLECITINASNNYLNIIAASSSYILTP